ncbi:hypothetical protein DFJ74DRAFT_394319 [Hyaloraphidium curvatum]|nr:hypothetical protein DFJ74DRAFT_394319 [Hyaloraphidium curvatum]
MTTSSSSSARGMTSSCSRLRFPLLCPPSPHRRRMIERGRKGRAKSRKETNRSVEAAALPLFLLPEASPRNQILHRVLQVPGFDMLVRRPSTLDGGLLPQVSRGRRRMEHFEHIAAGGGLAGGFLLPRGRLHHVDRRGAPQHVAQLDVDVVRWYVGVAQVLDARDLAVVALDGENRTRVLAGARHLAQGRTSAAPRLESRDQIGV